MTWLHLNIVLPSLPQVTFSAELPLKPVPRGNVGASWSDCLHGGGESTTKEKSG